ncbi:alpha/beta fold hydrolase [Segetibacter sp. 3557_3]|uniref:alpha/beta hydrolase n=1 Tax=Segetibacter sp. 3557_3 TaxID=2547429 RepID=UPI001058B0E1|nr:alpha/beta fold hydrolase [Segetibacter sp. 3557_3]TDH20661.1 alpha/beta fold hydrolase [Segetibacter sp. 3557_3]
MVFIKVLLILLALYLVLCGVLYWVQEKMIFFPQKLSQNFSFSFRSYEEISIKTNDGPILHSLLFKADQSKGVIFYLHGNAGSVSSWGELAVIYTSLGYDVFMPDYRGYGKSEGKIYSEQQFFDDMQRAYELLKRTYDESNIVVLGYSIGTSVATKIAADNRPKMLILEAPFYSLSDLVKNIYPFLPGFILKYKFRTDQFIRRCTMPVVIFHGDRDEIIYPGSSLKLKELMKPTDTLIMLKGEYHNGISTNGVYLSEIKKLL